jgi:hypothetical protein
LQEFDDIFGYIFPFKVIELAITVPLNENDELAPLMVTSSALRLTIPVKFRETLEPFKSNDRVGPDNEWLITTPVPGRQASGVGADKVMSPVSVNAASPGTYTETPPGPLRNDCPFVFKPPSKT